MLISFPELLLQLHSCYPTVPRALLAAEISYPCCYWCWLSSFLMSINKQGMLE